MPEVRVSPTALRFVLFGMPDAGKSSLLGALLQAAQSQEHVLHGRLTDQSGGLAELQQRVYEDRPRQTPEEIILYPVSYEPFAGPGQTAARLDALLIDCDGRVANELLARQRSLEGDAAGGTLAHAIADADSLVLVVDASANATQMDSDFGQFARFLRLLEQSRGRRNEVSGLPVYLVLTKCDLLVKPTDAAIDWLDRIEQHKNRVGGRFQEFLDRDKEDAAPFGRIDLHLWATAVKRPELSGTPAKPREPYGVAELFRQGLEGASAFRQRQSQSHRRLFLTVVGSLGLVALMGAGAVTLVLTRGSSEPGALERRVNSLRAREQEESPRVRHRDIHPKMEELTAIVNDPDFDALPAKKQEEVRDRLHELQAYEQFEKKLLPIQDPRDARSFAQLQEIETNLQNLKIPAEYRADWSNTDAGRRYSDYLDDIKAMRVAVVKVEDWYRNLAKDGKQVLDNAGKANLPKRAKKVLDEAKNAPFPENDPDKLLPGGKRATYAAVFGFTSVAELRRQWENEIKKKLEPAAKLEQP